MIKWQDCFYLVPGSELSERSVRSSGSDQSLSLSARSNTHSVSVLTELAWPSMLIIMSSTFPVTGTVMTCSDPGLSWVWPLTWSPGRLGSRTVHSPSSNPKGSLQKKPKKFHLLKRPFLTKKGQWFLVTKEGVRASVTFVIKIFSFLLEAYLNAFWRMSEGNNFIMTPGWLMVASLGGG